MLQQPSHLIFAPPATTALSADQELGTQLSAPWAVLARAGWLAITLPALGLFLAALPLRYAQLAEALAAVRPSLGGWSTLAATANLSFEILFVGPPVWSPPSTSGTNPATGWRFWAVCSWSSLASKFPQSLTCWLSGNQL
jgi:hypothetical protein